MPDAVIGLPAIPGFAAGNWRLERNVARAFNPIGNTTQSVERMGYRWRAALRCPPYDEDDAAVLEGWFDEVSRADRWLYLSPPQATMRGNWNPAELLTNGNLLNGLTTGWTASGSTLSVNARQLKIKNSGAANGIAYEEINCEANKPHVLLVDGEEGNVSSLYAALRLTGGGTIEQDTYFAAPTRGVLMFVPSQAAMRLHLAVNTLVSDDHLLVGNVSVCRCLLVNGGGQSGTKLNVDGGPANTNAALKAGQFVTLRVKNRWQMVRLKKDFDTDANGAGTLRFEPALRDYPVDGEAVIVRNPFARYKLAEDVSESSLEAPKWKGFSVDAVEDPTEVSGEIQSDLIWAWDVETLSLAPIIGTGTPTFVNATAVATYFDSAGVMGTAPANTPRFDFDPVTLALKGWLVMVESRTNLAWPSEDFSHANWGNQLFNNWNAVAVTPNSGVSPDGNLSADLLTANAALPSGRFFREAVVPGATYTATMFLKKVSGTGGILFRVASGNNGVLVNESLAALNVSNYSTSKYTRAALTFTVPASGVNQIEFGLGFTANTGSFLAFGGDLQLGTWPANYIKTITGPVVCNDDAASLLLSLIAGSNAAEGTIMVEAICSPATSPSEEYAARLDNGTQQESILLRRLPANSECDAVVYNAAVAVVDTGFSVVCAPGATVRSALGYKTNDFGHSVNGNATQSDVSGAVPPVTTLRMGGNAHLRRIRLRKRRLPNQMVAAEAAL